MIEDDEKMLRDGYGVAICPICSSLDVGIQVVQKNGAWMCPLCEKDFTDGDIGYIDRCISVERDKIKESETDKITPEDAKYLIRAIHFEQYSYNCPLPLDYIKSIENKLYKIIKGATHS